MKSNEAQREMRKKEKLEKELKHIKAEGEAKYAELKTKQNQLQKSQEENARLEQQLKEQRVCLIVEALQVNRSTVSVRSTQGFSYLMLKRYGFFFLN